MKYKYFNNKGFTLIELLAVIVILSAMSIVVVVNVSNSVKNNDSKEMKSQEELAKSAAKIYFSLHASKTCVDISTLITGDNIDSYFPVNSKIDKIKDGSVKIESDGYTYQNKKCKKNNSRELFFSIIK